MRTIPLREFQREGAKAFGNATALEPWILSGREQEYLLVPITSENRMAVLDLAEGLLAVMSLRLDQAASVAKGMDQLSMDEIDAEIGLARAARRKKQHRS